jgi:hypothetical protein
MQAQQRRSSDTMVASATEDRTARVGIILSSFKGGEDHFGGTKFAPLKEPRPVNAELTPAQVKEMTRRAIELGGARRGSVERIIARDDATVLLVSRHADPNVVAAVQDILREHGRAQKLAVVTAEDAHTDTMLMPAPGVWARGEAVYRVPKSILHCDKLISIAPLRIENGRPSLSVDNYRAAVKPASAAGSPDVVAIDAFCFHPADYAIVGGTRALKDGKTVRHNLVIASTFANAADAVGTAILGGKPEQAPLLELANQRGFGDPTLDVIWMRGNEIEEAAVKFA